MKLLDCSTAPSPRRVRIFLAEKQIEIPVVQVDLRAGEHLSDAYRTRNPRCTVPVLELDDGTWLWETVAICDYLESHRPEPNLMGGDALERALVLQWNARIEQDGFAAAAEALRNRVPGLVGRALTGPDRYDQIAALADRGQLRTANFLADLDRHLADSRFVVGERFTMADITALVVVDFAARAVAPPGDDLGHLARWHREVASRPSASA